jgi:hypothetical protein
VILDDLLLYFFGGAPCSAPCLMLVARHPMRVALALIAACSRCRHLCAARRARRRGLPGADLRRRVMVFMVYVIMLLDVRDASFLRRYGKDSRRRSCSAPCCWSPCLLRSRGCPRIRLPGAGCSRPSYPGQTVLDRVRAELLAAFRADVRTARGRGHRGDSGHQERGPTVDRTSCCSGSASRSSRSGSWASWRARNALVMLMCMELMLNAVVLSLVTFSLRTATLSGAVLVFLIFVVACVRDRRSRFRSCCSCRASAGRSMSPATTPEGMTLG